MTDSIPGSAALTLEGPAYCCPVCLAEGDWYLLRHGDAIVSWACDGDLPAVLRAMQRDFERTEITVKESKR